MTRLNVYAPVQRASTLVRGGAEGDGDVVDTRSGTSAVLPAPRPRRTTSSRPNKTYYEIPIAIQDRSFESDGSLFYPDTREFFDEIVDPYIPDGEFSPIWNPEFFGNTIMVNGNTWPFQTVESAATGSASSTAANRVSSSSTSTTSRESTSGRSATRGLPRRNGEPHRRSRQPAADDPRSGPT